MRYVFCVCVCACEDGKMEQELQSARRTSIPASLFETQPGTTWINKFPKCVSVGRPHLLLGISPFANLLLFAFLEERFVQALFDLVREGMNRGRVRKAPGA